MPVLVLSKTGCSKNSPTKTSYIPFAQCGRANVQGKAMSDFYCLMMKVNPSQWALHTGQGALFGDTTFWTEPQCFVSKEFIGGKAIVKLYHIDVTRSQAGLLVAPPGSFSTHIIANLEPKTHQE